MLALPRLDGLPVQMVVNRDLASAAAVALAMLEADVIDESHVRGRWTNPVELVSRSLDTWWTRVHPRFEVLGSLYCHLARGGDDANFMGVSLGADEIVVHVGRKGPIRHVVLQPFIEKIERRSPGLGYHALAHLEVAALESIQILSPREAFCMASNVYWQGGDDETDILEMYRQEGEDGVDIYTRAQFDAQIPRAAFVDAPWKAIKRRPPSRRARQDAELMEICSRVATLAKSRALDRLKLRDLRRREGGPVIEFGAVARWSARDDMLRIADDWSNEASMDSCWDTFGSWVVPITPKAMREFFTDLEQWLAMAVEVDRLLVRLGGLS
jgi:PRTRC genetic system protein F